MPQIRLLKIALELLQRDRCRHLHQGSRTKTKCQQSRGSANIVKSMVASMHRESMYKLGAVLSLEHGEASNEGCVHIGADKGAKCQEVYETDQL